ncbi:E3 ubiquitin-protein ligase XIAP-like isoform X2 [Clavelina lepadiformis]|uniref:E3 ubiquitin-protein ligase XIAP-like isoform X2 n=1 Tax=Clavelina lepadiformis TaxID=159417 RepID=UPI00404393ED
MSVSEERVFYPEDVHAGQWDIHRISEEIFQFRSNILKNLDIWLTELCEIFANHLFSTEDTKQSLSTFQHEIKSQCKTSYFEADSFCESHVLTLVKNTVYLVFHVSMADFTHILNDPDFHNIKLLTTLSFFLNYNNIRYRNLLGSEKDNIWFATKTDVVKQVIKRLAKNTSNDIEYAYLLPCALELDDFHLQKGVQKHLIKCWSDFSSVCNKIMQTYKFVSSVVQEDSVILADGRVYDRARDPPGQRSLYIPPGDPVKESYRLSTFIKFPQKSPVNPSNLAKVGFYYTGYKDRVKCFSCGLCVEHWTLGDDVKSSRWHRNDCQMMKGEECGNVPIGGIFARFVSQGVQMRDNLATESRQASGESKSNVSESHANLPVVSTVKPAGEVINQTGSRRHESAQTARPVRQPPPSTNYQREELATIPSVHHKQLVRSLDLRREADRMRSFSNWALETRTVYPSDLARSGFFYLGNLDRVQCFSCGGVLRNWNYGDNVHAEHRRHFPNCRMVQGTDSRNISIPPGDRLAPPDRPAVFREPPDPSETEQVEMQRVRSQHSDAMESSIVRFAVEMGFEHQVICQLITRNEMYHLVESLIEDLTPSPPSDHSDSGITAQATEEPMEWQYSMPNDATPSLEARIREEERKKMEEERKKMEEEKKKMEEEKKKTEEEKKCKICLDQMADVVFVPCGHLCSCTECAQALRKCPICRMKIEKSIRTYMS